ncbi:MAG: hypothetical protein MHM6MM_001048 [Cercozoa sp. M6MM]
MARGRRGGRGRSRSVGSRNRARRRRHRNHLSTGATRRAGRTTRLATTRNSSGGRSTGRSAGYSGGHLSSDAVCECGDILKISFCFCDCCEPELHEVISAHEQDGVCVRQGSSEDQWTVLCTAEGYRPSLPTGNQLPDTFKNAMQAHNVDIDRLFQSVGHIGPTRWPLWPLYLVVLAACVTGALLTREDETNFLIIILATPFVLLFCHLLCDCLRSRRKVAMISAAQELTTRIQARLETLHGFTINIEFVDNGVLSLPRGQFKMFKFPFSKMHVPFYMRIQTPTQSAPSPIVTAHHEVGIEINDPAVQEMVSRMSPEELRMNMFSTLTNP